MMRPPNRRRHVLRPPAIAASLVAACALGLASAGCSRDVLWSPARTLAHSFRGVPDDDLAVTPRQGAKSDDVPVADRPVARPVAPNREIEARPKDPLWPAPTAGGGAAPAPPGPASVVNVFGEIDGVDVPQVRSTGDAGFQQHTFTDEGADSDVNIDPSGKWLIFASTRHSEHPDIYMQRVDGTSVMQLTSDAADDAYPCISPDGKQIAFASTRAGTWQVYLMDTDGRNVVQVTSGNMQCVHPSFSPDGMRLVYAAIGSRSNQWELWTANLQTNEKRMVGYGLFPAWSPDKKSDRIAYQRSRQRGGRWFSLWTLDLIENEGRRMTEVAASVNAAIVSPCWSPDGKRLAFTTIVEPSAGAPAAPPRTPPGKRPAAAPRGQQDVWTIDADGSNRQRLTDGNGTNIGPCWSSDNRVYFISDRGGKECVWSVHADPARAPVVAEKPGGRDTNQKTDAAAAATDPREADH